MIRRSLGVALISLGVLFATAGCKPKHPYILCKDVTDTGVPVADVPLRTGDQVEVRVPRMSELDAAEPFRVTADGSIVLPLVGVFKVEGLTTAEAERKLNARLNGIIVNPAARISVVNPRLPYVSVIGEVSAPGRYPMEHDEGVMAALSQAGGLTEFADVKSIYLVRKYPQRIRVRLSYYDLTGGVECPSALTLRDGDVLVVE